MPKGVSSKGLPRPCPKCNEVLITGKGPYCKQCKIEYYRENYDPNYRKDYLLSHKDQVTAWIISLSESDAKRKARWVARIAYPDEQLCQECGSTRNIHRHHPDYSKPFDITWLCIACHKKEHK